MDSTELKRGSPCYPVNGYSQHALLLEPREIDWSCTLYLLIKIFGTFFIQRMGFTPYGYTGLLFAFLFIFFIHFYMIV